MSVGSIRHIPLALRGEIVRANPRLLKVVIKLMRIGEIWHLKYNERRKYSLVK